MATVFRKLPWSNQKAMGGKKELRRTATLLCAGEARGQPGIRSRRRGLGETGVGEKVKAFST